MPKLEGPYEITDKHSTHIFNLKHLDTDLNMFHLSASFDPKYLRKFYGIEVPDYSTQTKSARKVEDKQEKRATYSEIETQLTEEEWEESHRLVETKETLGIRPKKDCSKVFHSSTKTGDIKVTMLWKGFHSTLHKYTPLNIQITGIRKLGPNGRFEDEHVVGFSLRRFQMTRDKDTLKSLFHPKHDLRASRATKVTAGLVWNHRIWAVEPERGRFWANVEKRDPVLPPYFEVPQPPNAPYYRMKRADLAEKGKLARQKLDAERQKKRQLAADTIAAEKEKLEKRRGAVKPSCTITRQSPMQVLMESMGSVASNSPSASSSASTGLCTNFCAFDVDQTD
ncbi:unnamed protein product [Orchesella dallaii]|uniref:Uncharacterized protein n=1 Tax=Orchesella dallaii TaxID=48710 RepID=A0ABP1QGN6_9HEXA